MAYLMIAFTHAPLARSNGDSRTCNGRSVDHIGAVLRMVLTLLLVEMLWMLLLLLIDVIMNR